MADDTSERLVTIQPGEPSEMLNGMTTNQVHDIVVNTEMMLMSVCRNNLNLRATMMMELCARMVMDADDVDHGEDMRMALHEGIDMTLTHLRAAVAKWRAEQERANQIRKDLS